jgi:hypothetical protein
MDKLAITGGRKARTKDFPSWSEFDPQEEKSIHKVLKSGKWWRFSQRKDVENIATAFRKVKKKVGEIL